MEQREVFNTTNFIKAARPKSLLAWMTNKKPAAAEQDEDKEHIGNKLEIEDENQYLINKKVTPVATITIDTYTELRDQYNNLNNPLGQEAPTTSDIKIPDRQQSQLYTPFHDNSNGYTDMTKSEYYNSKRRSHYYPSNLTPADALSSNASSLTRSTSWQPSTSNNANNGNNNRNSQQYNVDSIPVRRTSRNYASNPEVQAKLNAMLSSDRALYLSSRMNRFNQDYQQQ